MSLAHLERLNPDQRRAVEHGVGEAGAKSGRPLLVIAGAGSGKASTLAHRVAHLVVNGADPRRVTESGLSAAAAGTRPDAPSGLYPGIKNVTAWRQRAVARPAEAAIGPTPLCGS